MIQNGVIHLDYALKQDGYGDLQQIFCPQEDPQNPSTPVYYNKGWYFDSADINPLSKHKPFISPKILFTTTAERDTALKNTRYGFGNIPYLRYQLDGVWEYHKPSGNLDSEAGDVEPWRLKDFDGYYHNSPSPIKLEVARLTKGEDTISCAGRGGLDLLVWFDWQIPNWERNYSLSISDLIDPESDYWNYYDICFVIRNETKNKTNFVATNKTCAEVFGNSGVMWQAFADIDICGIPALPMLRESDPGDIFTIIVCLHYHISKEGEIVIYTDDSDPPWRPYADGSYSLAFTQGTDRVVGTMENEFSVKGATGSVTEFTIEPTDTVIDLQSGHGRKFKFNIKGSIDTTNCPRDWSIGISNQLTVPISVRFYVTEGPDWFYLSSTGQLEGGTYDRTGYDSIGRYYEYDTAIALAYNYVNDRTFLYYESDYEGHHSLNFDDTIYMFAPNGMENQSVSTVMAKVFLRQTGEQEIELGTIDPQQIFYDRTYVVENPVVRYSTGNKIKADGSNYAWITGTVKTYDVGVLTNTENDVTLTPSLITNKLYIEDNKIYGYDLENNETQELSATVEASYLYSASVSAGYVVQEANIIDNTTIDIRLIMGGQQSHISSAGATLPYYCYLTRTTHDTWTSGAIDVYDDHQGSVNVYIDSVYAGQVTHDQFYNIVFSRNTSNQFVSKTIKFAYADDETIYQEQTAYQNYNTTTYIRNVSFDCENTIPYTSGTYDIVYASYKAVIEYYSDGGSSEEQRIADTSNLMGLNCSLETNPIQISGEGRTSTYIPENLSTYGRNIVIFTDSGGSDIITQQGRPA